MRRKILLLLICTIVSFSASSKVKLSAYFGDNMILQQQAKNIIKGTANKNTKVTLFTSWDKKKYSVKSDKNGLFSIEITTPQHGGPYFIKIYDGEELVINNIHIGDVWLCSGQSNMEMPVKGYRGQPVNNSHSAIVEADANRSLRLFTIERSYSTTPVDSLRGHWSKSDPKSVANFSATAYFFGDLLEKKLNIPVGLIHSSWSASKIEAWMNKETISKFPEFDLSILNNTTFGYPNGTATLLYNSMIHPLEGLAIKGVIWYQGEANSEQPALYERLFEAWANQWRTFFNNPEMPIYYVQIAPFQSLNKNDINLALFREAQLNLMDKVSNVGMVFTTDIGDEIFIHAPEKRKVGERLAYWALAKTYGIEGIYYCGPIVDKYEKKDGKINIYFKYGEDGLTPENVEVKGFEIAGSDGIFVEAKAKIINGSPIVTVWHESIPNPSEIRYCFKNYVEGNLANNVGLPSSSFRLTIE